MKKEFSGYYELDTKDITRLWADGVVVFDTNVLLHTYRVPKKTREQLLSILKKIKSRIWIPYQVGVEYQRNRISALRTEFARSKGVVTEIKKSHAEFVRNVRSLDMTERGVGAEVEEELKKMEQSATALIEHLKAGMDGSVAPGEKDHILDALTTLFNGKVGPRPLGQEDVDALYVQAKKRYAAKMGPGYMDEPKAGDYYQADGIVYDRQFGDYLLWCQLLSHVREKKLKDVIFVTSDVKEDWWLDTKSSSGIRPLPELCMEMQREGGADRFWMYTLHEFMSEANKHLNAGVTQEALDDVKHAESESSARYSSDPSKAWKAVMDAMSAVNDVRPPVRNLGFPSSRPATTSLEWSDVDKLSRTLSVNDFEVLEATGNVSIGVRASERGRLTGAIALYSFEFSFGGSGMSKALERLAALPPVFELEVFVYVRPIGNLDIPSAVQMIQASQVASGRHFSSTRVHVGNDEGLGWTTWNAT